MNPLVSLLLNVATGTPVPHIDVGVIDEAKVRDLIRCDDNYSRSNIRRGARLAVWHEDGRVCLGEVTVIENMPCPKN